MHHDSMSDDYIWPSSKAKPSAFALASKAFRSWCPREAASGGGTALPIWRCLLWTLPQNWKSSGKPCIDISIIVDEAGAAQTGLHILGRRTKASTQMMQNTHTMQTCTRCAVSNAFSDALFGCNCDRQSRGVSTRSGDLICTKHVLHVGSSAAPVPGRIP